MKKLFIVLSISFIIFLITGCKAKTVYITQKPETKIEYIEVEKPVEVPITIEKEVIVKKPIEVIKEVEVEKIIEVEKIVEVEKEVEKIVYVEKSYANINGMEVEVLGDNLYRKEFNLHYIDLYKTYQGNIYTRGGMSPTNDQIKEYNNFSKLFEGQLISPEKRYNGCSGSLYTKSGYIIKSLVFVNLENKMMQPEVYDSDYNYIASIENDKRLINHKFTYTNIDKENLHIVVNHKEDLLLTNGELYTSNGVKTLIIEFSLRGE